MQGRLTTTRFRYFFVVVVVVVATGVLSFFPTARSFGSITRRSFGIETMLVGSNSRLRFAPSPPADHQKNDNDERSTILRSKFKATNIRLGTYTNRGIPLLHSFGSSEEERYNNRRRRNRNGGWLPSNVVFGSAGILRVAWRQALSKMSTTFRTKANTNTNTNNTKDDPLNRVRVFRQLPLRKACLAIVAYLSVGVLAFKVIFPEPSWSVLDALYFSCVCLSTIGYGDFVPSRNSGKVFAALFGMSGILLWSSAIVSVGTTLVHSETTAADENLRSQRKNAVLNFYEEHMPGVLLLSSKPKEPSGRDREKDKDKDETPIEEEEETSSTATNNKSFVSLTDPLPLESQNQERREKGLQWILLARSLARPLVIIVSGGTLIGKLEGWDLCDSFYFSFVTAATIGFGDVCPSTRAGRMVAIALIPVLLAAAGDFFARVGIFVIKNRTQQLFASQAERAEWLTEEQAKKMDLDSNGKVSKSEYVLYMLIEAGIVGRDEYTVLEEQFARFDVTKSGYIEAGDLKAMKKFREKLRRDRTKGNTSNAGRIGRETIETKHEEQQQNK